MFSKTLQFKTTTLSLYQNRCYKRFHSIPLLRMPEMMISAFLECLLHLSMCTIFFSFKWKKEISSRYSQKTDKLETKSHSSQCRLDSSTFRLHWLAGRQKLSGCTESWKCSKPGSFLASPGSPGSVGLMLGLAQHSAFAAPALQPWSSTTGLALRETWASSLLQQSHTHSPACTGDLGFQARLEMQHPFSATQR